MRGEHEINATATASYITTGGHSLVFYAFDLPALYGKDLNYFLHDQLEVEIGRGLHLDCPAGREVRP